MATFDGYLGTMTGRLCDRIVGLSANGLYLPPNGAIGQAVRIRAALAPMATSTDRDLDGRDETNRLRTAAAVPVADFDGVVPVKYGRLRMDDRPDPDQDLTIVEEPTLQAGEWELILQASEREQIGLPRTGA